MLSSHVIYLCKMNIVFVPRDRKMLSSLQLLSCNARLMGVRSSRGGLRMLWLNDILFGLS